MRWIEIVHAKLDVGVLVWRWLASHSSADDPGPIGPVYMASEVERGVVRYISTYTRREIPQYNRCAA